MRAYVKRKSQHRFDEAYRLAFDFSLPLTPSSNEVFRHLLHAYPDQFEKVNGVCTRQKRPVPMT